MPLVTPNEGELELLDKMLKEALTVDENLTLQLFRNDYTITDDTKSSSFTVATFTNYSAQALTRANWSTAATVAGKAQSEYSNQLSWTCGATGDTVYGYWVVGVSSAKVLWAERFGTPRALADSDILNLTPRFTFSSEDQSSP
jgi:hypothetical protein